MEDPDVGWSLCCSCENQGQIPGPHKRLGIAEHNQSRLAHLFPSQMAAAARTLKWGTSCSKFTNMPMHQNVCTVQYSHREYGLHLVPPLVYLFLSKPVRKPLVTETFVIPWSTSSHLRRERYAARQTWLLWFLKEPVVLQFLFWVEQLSVITGKWAAVRGNSKTTPE